MTSNYTLADSRDSRGGPWARFTKRLATRLPDAVITDRKRAVVWQDPETGCINRVGLLWYVPAWDAYALRHNDSRPPGRGSIPPEELKPVSPSAKLVTFPAQKKEEEIPHPTIMVNYDIPRMVAAATTVLSHCSDIYQHWGQLFHIAHDHRRERVSRVWLRERLSGAARWVEPGRNGPVPCLPPARVVSAVLCAGSWLGVSHWPGVSRKEPLK